jgi:hypothetical protein
MFTELISLDKFQKIVELTARVTACLTSVVAQIKRFVDFVSILKTKTYFSLLLHANNLPNYLHFGGIKNLFSRKLGKNSA